MSDSDYPVEAIAAADATRLAERVGRASDAELAEGMSDPVLRKTVLDQIFARMADHVDPEQIRDLDAVVHFKITGAPGSDQVDLYEAVFRDGAVAVSPDPRSDHPDLRITVPPVTLVKLVTGHESAPAMLMSGQLKLWGDLFLARRMRSFFRIPGDPGAGASGA